MRVNLPVILPVSGIMGGYSSCYSPCFWPSLASLGVYPWLYASQYTMVGTPVVYMPPLYTLVGTPLWYTRVHTQHMHLPRHCSLRGCDSSARVLNGGRGGFSEPQERSFLNIID